MNLRNSDIDGVNSIFECEMYDPEITPASFLKRLKSPPSVVVERTASVILPDLITIVTACSRDDADPRQFEMRTRRLAKVWHTISIRSALLKPVRDEYASVAVTVDGLAPDEDDLDDPDTLTDVLDELRLPKVMRIMGIKPLPNSLPIEQGTYFFDVEGNLTDGTQKPEFERTFTYLGSAVGVGTTDPKLVRLTNNR